MGAYPNGKGVVCKTIDFYHNRFDSGSTQQMNFNLLIVLTLISQLNKVVTNYPYVLSLVGLTTTFQILTVVGVLLLFINLKKI